MSTARLLILPPITLLIAACAAVAPASSAPASAEPVTWSRHDLGADGPALHRIVVGGPGFIGVGQAGDDGLSSGIWTSPDALAWTSVGDAGDNVFADIVIGGPGFVAIAASPASVWTSTDGASWAEAPGGTFSEDDGLLSIATDGTTLVVAGRTQISTSTDGRSWDRADVPAHEGTIHDVVAGGPGFVAVGSELVGSMEPKGAVWTSVDGEVWDRVEDRPEFEKGEPRAVAAEGSTLVATGWATDIERGIFFSPTAWTSTDGQSWRRAIVNDDTLPAGGSATGALEGAVMLSLARGPAGWVSAGTALEARSEAMTNDAALWTSADGVTWDRVPHDVLFEAGMSSGAEFGGLSVTAGADRTIVVGRTAGPQTTLWISPAQPGGSVPVPRPSEREPSGVPGGGVDATPAPPAPSAP